ncbi:MAG: TlpA family protein disulfide reductase [Bryobacterales bacterium]|nr:TlpA family protein disulfide reductase [Bryobacterales bacterium]
MGSREYDSERSLTGLWLALSLALTVTAAWGACDFRPEVDPLLREARLALDDTRLSRDERLALLRAAAMAYPDEVVLHHEYQNHIANELSEPVRDLVIEEYRKLASGHTGSVAARYLYARSLVGRRTREAAALLELLAGQHAEFPWPHLALAEARAESGGQHLERFFRLCPGTLNETSYTALMETGAPQLRRAVAEAARKELSASKFPSRLADYHYLWMLEIADAGPAERTALLERIAEDAARLRSLDSRRRNALLPALLQAYQITGDRAGWEWARGEIAKWLPHSFTAAQLTLDKWRDSRALPAINDSRETVAAYYRQLYLASAEWIRTWPLARQVWALRWKAARELPDLPDRDVEAAGAGMLTAVARNGSTRTLSPRLDIAGTFLARSIATEKIPEIVEEAIREAEIRALTEIDPRWMSDGFRVAARRELDETRSRGRLVLVRFYLQSGKPEKARQVLRDMKTGLVYDAANAQRYWAGRPALAGALVELREFEEARSVLAEMKQWLAARTEEPAEEFRIRQADYWLSMARLAEAEGRKLDAAAYYRLESENRTEWDYFAERFARIDRMLELWRKSGGTEEGFRAWAGIREPAGGWQFASRPLIGFELRDLAGRSWSTADFRGKVTLVNLWATWCGPCLTELPHLEKLHRQMNSGEGMQFVTFNVDEDAGSLPAFMKRHSYTFPVIPAREFIQDRMRVTMYPRTWIVGRDGTIRYEHAGFSSRPERWLNETLELLRHLAKVN